MNDGGGDVAIDTTFTSKCFYIVFPKMGTTCRDQERSINPSTIATTMSKCVGQYSTVRMLSPKRLKTSVASRMDHLDQ
jgi:hypothetical protein